MPKTVNPYTPNYFPLLTHELKNPLSIVYGSAQIISQYHGLDRLSEIDLSKHLSYILKNCQKLSRLYNSIVYLINSDSHNIPLFLSNIEVVGFIKRIIKKITEDLKPSCEITFSHGLPDLTTTCDPLKLEQLLLNLLSNAIKYTNGNSVVKISLKMNKRNMIVLSVSDNGIGISQNIRRKIFTPFFYGPEARSLNPDGLGIGLYIARQIALLHEGTLTLTKTSPEGSTFTLKLPHNCSSKTSLKESSLFSLRFYELISQELFDLL